MSRPRDNLVDSVFAHAGSGLCLLDAEGRVLRANDLWIEAVGSSHAEVVGRDIWALLPDAGPELRALHAEARATHEVRTVPPRAWSSDGEERWYEGSIAPVALEDGTGLLLTLVNVTSSRRIEAKLRATEARFQHVLDGLVSGCRILDRAFRYQYVNAAFLRQTGKTEADFLGRTIFEVYPELAGSPICKALERSMAERVPLRIEHRLTLPDGTVSWFDLSVQPTDEGLFVLSIDINERKRAEEALRASEARFQHVLDGMLEGCVLLDHDFRYLYANAAALQQRGKRAEEMLGRTVMEVFPGVEQAPLFETLARCMRERTSARIEGELHFESGRSGWFELSVQPQPEGLFVLSIDITQRKHAEAALRTVKDELEAIFRASPVAFAALDTAGNALLWSAAAERLFGYRSSEIVGRPLPIIPADKQEEFAALRRRTRDGETIRDLRTERSARDGRRVPVSLSTSPLLDAEGTPKGMVAVLVDRSDEEALRAALGDSEHR